MNMPTNYNNNHINKYDWGLYPHAEEFLKRFIKDFLNNNSFAQSISSRMELETSTQFYDWIDHIVFPENIISKKGLEELGFQEADNIEAPGEMCVFMHPGAIFPPILLCKNQFTEISLKPERLDHFIQMIGKGHLIDGLIYGPYRKAVISVQNSHILSAVERRGFNGFIMPKKVNDTVEYRQAMEVFICRQRYFENTAEGIDAAQKLVDSLCKKLSNARTADAFFRAERYYWERRNWVGQSQKARQDRLGLGWGNHDHHTYRSSRKNFTKLIKIFQTLGFTCREKFYAGDEAGWGAQLLEHPQCNIVIFADIDLQKEEKKVDFVRQELKQANQFGTVGLWVELHGESILQAGLHHLAARFTFEKLRLDLTKLNINTMIPFSYFEFLKQAFTEGEIWNIDSKRLEHLLYKKSITKTQYETFLNKGAVGSHLENVQRTQGFKGFNQRSVSAIIIATDPRKYKA